MEQKRQRCILSSTHIDSHGEQVSKAQLQEMVETINSGSKLPYNVEHRKDLPPKGRIENAELIERNGYYLVIADVCSYDTMAIAEWNEKLIIESFEQPYPFAGIDAEMQEESAVFFDPHNFSSEKHFDVFADIIKSQKNSGVHLGILSRKSILPDPEIIFAFGKTVTLYQLLKPIAKKIGENVADEISEKTVEESKKLLVFINKCLKNVFHYAIPKTRPVCVVFSFSGKPQIELVARTRNDELVLKGLSESKLADVRKEVESIALNVSAAKIQFLLSDKGKWKLNYLLTTNGDAIGTKIAFQKRDRKIEMISHPKPNKKSK